ncbi:Na/Pi cotransporter family protein [Limibaculum sp. FT325]|uniref:Na/Pi cotransporter family protein n=1 Tax=Thermohalobaculum sediminis TaxID=2939436 RepID=UPI0020BE8108|nr:Na/Pi cotransporter family protein [Limibaculum sediminis]MCL5775650.1 Na/Pi cotransporter family protein [Limibaculum sediminis]
MSGHMLLVELAGAVALLVWAARLARTGMERVLGERLRRAIGLATRNRVAACATGVGVAAALQSSTATALLLTSFTSRGLIALAPALAVMLGADVGSSLVVQALIFDIGGLVPILIFLGVALFMGCAAAHLRNMGRLLIGLGLMLMALGMISAASEPLRDDALLQTVLQRLASDPLLALGIAALLTWLAHSSVASILFFISLAAGGILSPELALTFILGANVGAGFVPLGLALRSGGTARRMLVGNLVFRLTGALVVLPFLPLVSGVLAGLDWGVGRQLANAHTAFNLALALGFLPLAGLAARLLERLMPEPEEAMAENRLPLLDPAALDRPRIALSGASREALRIAETVELMLREAIRPFEEADGRRREEIRSLDAGVDTSCEAVVRYLTRLMQRELSPAESREAFDLILFTTNLEHVGDIIDKNLLALAQKKQRLQLAFSPEGWRELQRMHNTAVEQMRLSVAVFVTRDLEMARELVRAKEAMRTAERQATESHLRRLREGTPASIETSSLHLDMLRDLKRVVAHVTAVAHPILEAAGELKDSRLRDGGGSGAPDRAAAPAPALR